MTNRESKVSASMMCANPFYLGDTIRQLEKGGVEYLHMDVMDGKFVPNLGIALDHMKALRKSTKIPFDYHLMVCDPDGIIPLLDAKRSDIITIHYESTYQVQRTLENARRFGCKVFVAINPATSISALDEVIHYVDGVNMLMVNPGFAGQKAVESCFDKAERFRDFLMNHGRHGIDWEVDGNITCENAKRLKALGANIFVAGTSSVFKDNRICSGAILRLRKSVA